MLVRLGGRRGHGERGQGDVLPCRSKDRLEESLGPVDESWVPDFHMDHWAENEGLKGAITG
jgi:hypothetical protein